MTIEYDAAIIGTGSAGTAIADGLAAAGWKVAVIDWRPFGGTCALRGCDPKKVLVAAAQALDGLQRWRGRGIAGEAALDWAALMAFKRSFTEPVPAQRERGYADQGITAYHYPARFAGRNLLAVGSQTLDARHIVIAAGAEPVRLGIPGEEYLLDSERFLDLENLPRRIAIVGGGYIAAEFAGVAARAGAEVTILQHGEAMLKQFDPDMVALLMRSFTDLGITVRLGAAVEAIEKTGGGFRLRASGAGAPGQGGIEVEADLVVHAAGRAPRFDALAPEAGGVAIEHGRLRLNRYLQSATNPAVYAAGDAARAGPPLTPVASHDAQVVLANLLRGNHAEPDYSAVPSVAFTIPPIASVGLSEAQAGQQMRLRVHGKDAADWYTARHEHAAVYGFKVLVDQDSDRIAGAHLVGPGADQTINLFALAMRHGLKASQLAATMFAYPTPASDLAHMLPADSAP